MSRPSKWQKLGETTLTIDQVCAKAYEIFGEKFSEFDAKNANPAQFTRAFASALVPHVKDNPIWKELEKQDWSKANIDINVVLDVNCESFRNSSFGSRSNSSTSRK